MTNSAANITIEVACVITYDTESYDNDTMHSTVSKTSRMTFNTAGVYDVTAGIEWAANATGYRQAAIYLNGGVTAADILAIDLDVTASATFGNRLNLSTQYKFIVGDYIEVKVDHNCGVALNVNATGKYSPVLAVHWLGAGT